MTYALIPDGYTLKKVTKAQEKALKDKRRHDNVVELIKNPELMKQIIIVAAGYLALKEANDLYEFLAEQGVNITQNTKDAYTKKRQFGDAPVAVSLEQIIEQGLGRLFPN
jgi:anion-transporting  ArsA/GET3 family ATPase